MRGLRGIIEDCTPGADWSWHNVAAALNPKCWAYSPEGWRELASIPKPPMPTPVLTPPDPRMVPVDEADAQATIDAIIAQNKAAQDEQYLRFFETVPEIPVEPASPWLWITLAGAGILAFSMMGGRRRRGYA